MKMKKISFVGIMLVLILVIGVPNVFGTNSTVGVDSSMNTAIAPDYPVNEQGQTYGSLPYAGGKQVKEPDLIRAEGENGVIGYVKASDLDSTVSSPEEAIAYNEDIKAVGYESVPLYESDGKTVIGEFRMYYSKSTSTPLGKCCSSKRFFTGNKVTGGQVGTIDRSKQKITQT